MEKLKQRKFALLIVMVVLLPLIIFAVFQRVFYRQKAAVGQTKLSLVRTDTNAVVVGQDVSILANLDAMDKVVGGYDLIVQFDKNFLQYKSTTTTNPPACPKIKWYPADQSGNDPNVSGKVLLSGNIYDPNNLAAIPTPINVNESCTMAVFTFTAKAVTGSTAINYYFLGPDASTTDTQVLEYPTSADILGSVSNISFAIQSGVTPTLGPSATPTPVPSATPTTAPSLTPTPRPTNTTVPQPTATNVPGSTSLNLTVLLHGVGNSGDNVNPVGSGNMNPIHPNRSISVELYSPNNIKVASGNGTIVYNSTDGKFHGIVNMGTVASGTYLARVGSSQYLWKRLSTILQITSGQTLAVVEFPLTTGDTDGDNKLSILDYNMISDCFSDLLPARNCTDANKKLATDITDDGNVNQFDYNLFLRELSVQSGQ